MLANAMLANAMLANAMLANAMLAYAMLAYATGYAIGYNYRHVTHSHIIIIEASKAELNCYQFAALCLRDCMHAT